jgi:hypothetical protein
LLYFKHKKLTLIYIKIILPWKIVFIRLAMPFEVFTTWVRTASLYFYLLKIKTELSVLECIYFQSMLSPTLAYSFRPLLLQSNHSLFRIPSFDWASCISLLLTNFGNSKLQRIRMFTYSIEWWSQQSSQRYWWCLSLQF